MLVCIAEHDFHKYQVPSVLTWVYDHKFNFSPAAVSYTFNSTWKDANWKNLSAWP
jgi:hypothetical protein